MHLSKPSWKSIPSKTCTTGECPFGLWPVNPDLCHRSPQGHPASCTCASPDNSGKGMWFNGWAAAKDIDGHRQRIGATELTAKSFHALHPGKSINTGGFVMAVLK
jgi:hypothetical protein